MRKIEKWRGMYWVPVGDGVDIGYRFKIRAIIKLWFDI